MKPSTGYHSRRGRFPLRLSSHRLGFILILLSLVWGMYLIRVQLNDRRSQSEYLKERIISLSKEYIDALAKERGIVDMAEETEEVREMKKATAVLLQSMLSRLHHLEKQVENVIINSTSEFKHLTKAIKYLNSTIRNRNKTYDDDACFIPDHPEYPKCKEKVQWLKDNWRTSEKYQEHGVNGSLCSVLHYLSRIERWCPTTEFMKGATEVCVVPLDPGFPHCQEKVQWMETYWRSDPKYQSHGVDGSLCSFLSYLSEVENFCPLRPGRHVRDDCEIPTNMEYPQCPKKIAWMREFWKSDPCYENDHGVNGSVCSFIIYLSEVEGWCPFLPGRTGPKKVLSPPGPALRPHLNRKDVEGLLNLLTDKNPVKFQWIKRRIQVMWPHWQTAYSALPKKRDLTVTVRKKIIIFIGVLAGEERFHFATDAGKGGPLGELVQWSDLITTLYVLGHDITVTVDLDEVQRALGSVNVGQKKSCPQHLPEDIDLVYIDYIGLKDLNTKVGALLPQFLCKLRVLDSFGTEAQFNFAYSGNNVPGGSMGLFGRYNLNLRQFLTMFPHSPDNSFLGFVVKTIPLANLNKKPRRKARALVYGKHISFWKDFANKGFLQVVNKYFEIHATVGGASETELKAVLPPFVVNHGVVSQAGVQRLLNESMVFIGLGFPYEGPAPLEAIASGCFFINPKFNPPQNRLNTKFFTNKPTLRLLTSQHPYCEEFIGPPHVFTIDVNNLSEVEDVMKKIMISEVSPYLPFEFTHEGMLERVNALVQNQDFCVQNQWPPSEALITVKGDQGKSCKETCLGQGMVCEPEFFKLINTQTSLTMNGFPCNSSRLEQVSALIAPGFRKEPRTCILQTQSLMYSCTGTSPTTSRLCPCRKYKEGQVQLCQQC